VNPEEEKKEGQRWEGYAEKEGFKARIKKSEWAMEYQIIVSMTLTLTLNPNSKP